MAVEREADELLAAAALQPLTVIEAPRRYPPRPAVPTPALVSAVVVGEGDTVEEVAATDLEGPVAAAEPPEPEPLDLAPFLSASYHSYAAWYCAKCYQRRHDPGACPDCRKPLVPVHVVVVPRSLV